MIPLYISQLFTEIIYSMLLPVKQKQNKINNKKLLHEIKAMLNYYAEFLCKNFTRNFWVRGEMSNLIQVQMTVLN